MSNLQVVTLGVFILAAVVLWLLFGQSWIKSQLRKRIEELEDKIDFYKNKLHGEEEFVTNLATERNQLIAKLDDEQRKHAEQIQSMQGIIDGQKKMLRAQNKADLVHECIKTLIHGLNPKNSQDSLYQKVLTVRDKELKFKELE